MLKLPKLSTAQIDRVNIGLMIVSLILAYILPFEVFLFSYAVLGPLHYLTEISWLHQKSYFVPKAKKLSLWIFPLLAVILTGILVWDDVVDLIRKWQELPPLAAKDKQFNNVWSTNLIFFLFGIACVVVLLPKIWQKIVGIAAIIILCLALNMGNTCIHCTNPTTHTTETFCEDNPRKERAFVQKNGFDTNGDGYIDTCESEYQFPALAIFFSAYLPTLVHVYLFTMLFMLSGAIKSKSKTGLVAVVILIICGVMPFIWDPSFIHYNITEYARKSYDVSFLDLNQIIFKRFNLGDGTVENIYTSRIGIMLTRFIAFAYTYHYLNWFSKTSIIQWHKMPVLNLGIVLVLWACSILLYYFSYQNGLTALLFLSFLHVFMEFPLNWHSLMGIIKPMFRKKTPPANASTSS